jgi:hypothetical protein
MKKLIFLISIFVPMTSFGQLIDELPKSEDGKLNFNEVIQVDSIKQDQLYLNSKQFFVEVFKSAKDVIQMDDRESGIVIGKGFNDIYSKMLGSSFPVKMWYTIKIQSKDDRYKYEIYDIYFENYPSQYVLPNGKVTSQTAEDIFDKTNYFKKNGQPNNQSLNFKTQMTDQIIILKSVLNKSMNKSLTSNKKDNW